MPTQVPQIRVEGLADLHRAFAVANRTLKRELNKGLRDAVEPIRAEAELLAGTMIRNMDEPVAPGAQDWRRMRVGVTRTMVYVAPRSRGRGGRWKRRSNLFDLIVGRSFEPALQNNIEEVVERVDDVLGTVGRAWDVA